MQALVSRQGATPKHRKRVIARLRSIPRASPRRGLGIHSRILGCDWTRSEEDKLRVTEGLRAGARIVAPLYHLSISNAEAENLALARLWSNVSLSSPKPQWRGERYRHDKIRIAYLSADFRSNVLAEVIAGCFEHHDKTRFDTTAISLGRDDGSKLRRRIAAAFDRFIDATTLTDAEVATMLRGMEIDIAIDLQGYAGESRTGIFAHRPAAVQVNYLAYPGTLGLPFIDYIIADRIVIPEEHRPHYSEKVVYLPQCYLPNDVENFRAGRTPSRADEGLPEAGFVFACFNHAIKICPEIFDVWMRLLREADGSVLWLRSTNSASIHNLRREAKSRGVDPQRIIFAARKPLAEHLARQTLAGLFLDTLPYNGHTTASEALWAGLPVLTCLGSTFPGRVAASLLHAVGLPELVTGSLAAYEELARTLAGNPEKLTAIKSQLRRNRPTSQLFDTARFVRDLEAAYRMMWERSQRGETPQSLSVSGTASPSLLLAGERAEFVVSRTYRSANGIGGRREFATAVNGRRRGGLALMMWRGR